MSFSTFGLSPAAMQGVSSSGYNIPTEIQRKAIPLALEGKDIIGCAPTGTGKTAAFVLPMLTRLEQSPMCGQSGRFPRALILTPTRELAQQIEDAIRTYGKYTGIRPVSIYGGSGMGGQLSQLRQGVDIVVATPGRLLDHMQRGSIVLSRIEILVLDEADRMYDMGFIDAVRSIIAKVPARRQTLLFSATISQEVRSLVAGIQKNPHLIEIGEPFTPVKTVEQHFYYIPQQSKMDLLLHVLGRGAIETMLVFSRTKRGADKIARRLSQKGISSAAIHSNRSQSQRREALEGFKQRRHKVLVATDLAARGIDVSGISHVVNYDTPVFAEDYIHRIGRTGRAEAKGAALTFVSSDEEKYVKRIEYLIGKRFEMKEYPGFAYPVQRSSPANEAAPIGVLPFRKRKYYRTPHFA
jgi:ATP-dependent RNA helicase RhlE